MFMIMTKFIMYYDLQNKLYSCIAIIEKTVDSVNIIS